MRLAIVLLSFVVASACSVNKGIDDAPVDRQFLSDDWQTVPTFALPLINDAASRIKADPNYDLSCFEFTFGSDDEDDEYFVLVSHSESWLRANNKIVGPRHEYEGGFSYCGSDVSFRYNRSGQLLERVYQR